MDSASLDDRLLLIVLTAVVTAVLVSVVWRALSRRGGERARRVPARPVADRGALLAEEISTVALFEGAKDSVVFISTAARMVDPWTRSVSEAPRGSGSGFVWDDRGHVVTNRHVIEGASKAFVRLVDGRVFQASLAGAAQMHDLAVLKIEAGGEGLSPLPVGESSGLKVGQKVFAIGNPFGLDWTLTTGVVSALDRDLPTQNGASIRGLIQTDAAINPGNSGGPLLDSAGRLIGVNTAIFSPSGANAGIGFAVPVDLVNRVAPQLIATGRYAPPVLGVSIDPRVDALARRQGYDGVMVLGVAPGSPAEKAGLQAARTSPGGRLALGDAIIGVAGRSVENAEQLRAALDEQSAGDRVSIELRRGGETLTLEVVLAAGA